MIIPKTREQIELMRQSALLVSKTLGMIASEIKPGVTTLQLDKMAEAFIRDNGGIPGFLGLYGCPSTLLTSVNEEVVHGLPTNRPIEEGDIVSVDCGVLMNEYYGDHAYTFEIGEVAPATKKLLEVTKESLYIGIREFRAGNRVGDVANAIQTYTESFGYGVVRELVGHGLGKKMHEEPEMPNYGKRGKGKMFSEGMVVAIEPMINLGVRNIKTLKDGWTIVTADKKPSAHFEHDVAIIDGKPELLSTYAYIYKALGIESDEEQEFRREALVLS
ncbi:type I methionyl aminopeptidase [Flavobacterium selenitireducens]|uniref:type I methionyl aminopeptidase n=1 Tax=Flavobacterium selenitireducens TaxID=2722704 RepID=UPI00168AD385|nr:type I methionyl aminopeptidase [Flavobacterium selenitireducens]MBD3583241.1 type I methionyl aminopeptidase [Flavobacterium selenitireducens]